VSGKIVIKKLVLQGSKNWTLSEEKIDRLKVYLEKNAIYRFTEDPYGRYFPDFYHRIFHAQAFWCTPTRVGHLLTPSTGITGYVRCPAAAATG